MNNTDICNMALAYLAKGRINSIDEENESARQCKLFYDHTRRQLLRSYYFGFAKRLVKLAELDVSVPGWTYVYAYPERCLFARKIFNEHETVTQLEKDKYEVFLVSGNVKAMACDVNEAWVEYTYDVMDVELFSADFVEALARLLAFNICLPLAGSTELQQMQYQLAQSSLSMARYTTASEQYKKLEYPTSYIDARS